MKYFASVCCCLVLLTMRAQPPDFQVRSIDFEQSAVVNDLLQDELGYLWLATNYGLYRYNGYEYKWYGFDPNDDRSLRQNYLTDLLLDAQGHLWVATLGGGVARYDRRTDDFDLYEFKDIQNDNVRSIRSMLQLDSSSIWLGSQFGLLRLDTRSGHFDHYLQSAGLATKSRWATAENYFYAPLQKLPGGALLLRSGSTQSLFDTSTQQYIYITDTHLLASGGLPESELAVTSVDAQTGRTWMASCTQLYRQQSDQNFQSVLSASDLRSPSGFRKSRTAKCFEQIIQAEHGALWVRFSRKVFLRQNGRLYTLESLLGEQDRERIVRAMYLNATGTLWLATTDGQLVSLTPRQNPFNRMDLPTGIFDYETEQPLQLSGDPTLVQQLNNTPITQIKHIAGRDDGRYYLVRGMGLLRLRKAEGQGPWQISKLYHPDNSPLVSTRLMDAAVDYDGYYWLATYDRGLQAFDPNTEQFYHYSHYPDDEQSLSTDAIIRLQVDRQGQLWIGTFGGGLNIYQPGAEDYFAGDFRQMNSDNSGLSHNTITYLHEDEEGGLWVGTYSGGLNRLDPSTLQFRHYTMANGLPSNLIYTILEEQQYLWLGTERGLVRFDKADAGVQVFTTENGLPSNLFGLYFAKANRDGKFFMVNASGLLSFYPHLLQRSRKTYPLVLENFRIGNQQATIGSGELLSGTLATVNEVSLNHDENSVGWDYHAVNLENPSAVQYAYQLEGLHDDWVYAGTQRAVNFSNLPSGKYEFRLRASTDGEHWSVLASPFTLLIATPWWQSWWAYVIYALLLVAALWVLYSNQRQRWQLATQAQRLELMEKEKEAANLQSMLLGQEAERQRLSKDLHDGMGSILSNLKATFTYLWANKNDATAENYFNQTTEMINYASSEIRKISHDLMPGALERFGLVAAVQDLAQQMRTLHGLEVNLEIINLEQRPDRQTELMLFRIIQELSNNIIKYASANEVLLQLVQMEDQLSLVIEDDGVGFDLTKVENTQNGMGLRSVRSRVSFLKGELDIFSERGKGSTFSIQIPFKV